MTIIAADDRSSTKGGHNMNQTKSIQQIMNQINLAMKEEVYLSPDGAKDLLEKILKDLTEFHKLGVDFKDVIDALDDSILITDADSKVIYINPNYKNNTGIDPDLLLGKKVSDIVESGYPFTGGAVLDVLKTKKKAFRLSSVTITQPPETGYVIGVPLFDENGELKQVVASSRPIITLKALQSDFERFLSEANALSESKKQLRILPSTEVPSLSTKLVGHSQSLQQVWKMIQKAAPTDATVLITGESGVGKEIVADEIYRMSERNHKDFIKVNCASIPLNLLESELFGYEKGAFSGANVNGKQGLFEMANGGTLLLDEIGDMPLDLQAKLLRAIQNKEITRVGGTKPIPLDIRFIAATNSDLKKKMNEGTFRSDLYYRLNVVPIHIPPLRERKEDIRLICNHFIQIFSQKHNKRLVLNEKHYHMLEVYRWPGNIRELENVIEYLTICCSGSNEIDDYLLKGILDITESELPDHQEVSLNTSVENYERALIETVLKHSTSLRDAGSKLQVNASTLSRKIKQYGIDYPHSQTSREKE